MRLAVDYFISSHQLGESISVEIWRDGTEQKISIPLITKKANNNLVLPEQYDDPPEYYIISGIIFSPLSFNYLLTWGEDIQKNAPWKLLRYYYQKKNTANEQVVIINGLLTSSLTAGYEDLVDTRVITVNGETFASFKQFTALVDKTLKKKELFTLGTEDRAVLVISPKEHRKHEKKLLKLYGIDEPYRIR